MTKKFRSFKEAFQASALTHKIHSTVPEDWLRALALLKAEFPTCFISSKHKRPLAVGIHKAVFEHYRENPRCSRTALRQALRLYTHARIYLQCLRAGEVRIDLQGDPCGVVTEQEEQYAKEKLKAWQKKTS